jgi:hypothetical protein
MDDQDAESYLLQPHQLKTNYNSAIKLHFRIQSL